MTTLETLEDAWTWFVDTRLQLRLVERLARRYWTQLPWEGAIGTDDLFIPFEGPDLEEKADFSIAHLNDLAIVVMFSVFESSVRQRVLTEVETEEATIIHRAIKSAIVEAKERIEEGSFFHVLKPFKDTHADLVEEVNQVRRYRNWVAHGKRGDRPEMVEPHVAYSRLREFLEIVSPEVGRLNAE